MEQYEKGFQRFHAGEDVRPVTSCKYLLIETMKLFSAKLLYRIKLGTRRL